MELGKNLNIFPVRLENKYSIKEIDEILEEVNDTLYFFANKYINDKAKDYIKSKLATLGEKLHNVPTNGDRTARKKELLDKMRDIYRGLNRYTPETNPAQIENMCKYILAYYLKRKAELTDEDKFKYLRDNKLFCDIYGYSERIDSIQKEIIADFSLKKEE